MSPWRERDGLRDLTILSSVPWQRSPICVRNQGFYSRSHSETRKTAPVFPSVWLRSMHRILRVQTERWCRPIIRSTILLPVSATPGTDVGTANQRRRVLQVGVSSSSKHKLLVQQRCIAALNTGLNCFHCAFSQSSDGDELFQPLS